MALTANDIVILLSVGLISAAVLFWRVFYVSRSPKTEPALTDGAVLMLEGSTVVQASPIAIAMFGDCIRAEIRDVLEGFVVELDEACEMIDTLEVTGVQFDLMVTTPRKMDFHLLGEPAGALIRLTLREATYLAKRLAEAEERVRSIEERAFDLNEERETLSTLIQSAPLITWSRNPDGEVIWCGGMIQTRSGAVTAQQAVDLISARAALQQRQPVLVGHPQRSRVEVMLPEGIETVSLHVTEITGPSGTRVGFATDASMAASAERTLTRFVQTMTETFAHLTVGLAIFDRNQTLALFNPALVQLWQVEPSWLAGRPSLRVIIDELRATRRLPDMQDFHKWRSKLLGLFENTEAAAYEELWHLSDGSNIRVLARPHPHGSLAFIFDDVTERMRLEQRYRHSIDLRRATLDRLTDGIAVFGANGILQFVNQAFHDIWDTDSESVYPAMHARQLVGLCEDLTVETEVWRRLHSFITGDERRRAWTARLTMGSGRKLAARIAPLPDGSTMTVFADITDAERNAIALHERNQALEAAEAMRAEVLDQLSYKLRTPLNSIMGFGQLIADDRFQTEQEVQKEYASNIVTAAIELQETIQTVTELASLELDQIEYEDSELNIVNTLHDIRDLLEKRAVETGVALTVCREGCPGAVTCNAVRLRQIIFNLAADAVQRCRTGGRVELGGAWREDQGLSIYTLERSSENSGQAFSHVNSLTLDLIRRLVHRERGRLEITDGVAPGEIKVSCHFEYRAPSTALGELHDALPAPGDREEDADPAEDERLPSNVHKISSPQNG